MPIRGRWSRAFRGFLIAAALASVVGTMPAAAELQLVQQTAHQSNDLAAIPAEQPAGWQAAPAATTPTGHEVAARFRSFYDTSGGLPVFGYAISPPVLEQSRMAQYFERQRFEHHPQHKGTPYEVLLGRLGVAAAERAGLIASEPFARRPAPVPTSPDCTYVEETGHRLCLGFRDYWQSHGLEFGDPGVSYRESLALFGYPISEEFSDPATGLTVQYFERARFEHHPNNPASHRVLLGLLAGPLWAQAAPTAQVAVEAEPLGEEIAATAMRYLGSPYAWAGTSPAGFDCSGFIYFVVNSVIGGGFPRTLDQMLLRGTPVNRLDLRPGDIVFQENTYQWGLSHGGIYIGNGQFIHSESERTGVIISDLWSDYWGSRFLTARRLS